MEWRLLVEADVFGHPKPKGSARGLLHRRTGRVIVTHDNPGTTPWQELVSLALQRGRPADGPTEAAVRVWLEFSLPRPKSLPKRMVHAIKKPDVDKLCRTLLDALTGVVVRDDSQVVELQAVKRYGVPGVKIRVEVAA